jgi:hypothetical protein
MCISTKHPIKTAREFMTLMILQSSFDSNNVRTITKNSPDIVEGEIVGKYEFNQLENLVKNSLGFVHKFQTK